MKGQDDFQEKNGMSHAACQGKDKHVVHDF